METKRNTGLILQKSTEELDGERPRTDLPHRNKVLMIYLPGILPFFTIHVNQFLAPDDSPAANVTSRHVVGEGPGAIP